MKILQALTVALAALTISPVNAVFIGTSANSLTRGQSLVFMLLEPGQAHSYAISQSALNSVLTRPPASQISESLFARTCNLDSNLFIYFPPLNPPTGITCVEDQALANAIPFSDVAGFALSGTVSAGDDAAESDVRYQASGTQAVPAEVRLLDSLSGDFQRITFSASGTVPSTIDVDMIYSISASVSYAAGAALSGQFPGAQAIIEVLDPGTLSGAQTGPAVISIIAFADNVTGLDESLNSTATLTIEPNKEYFLLVGSGSTLTLTGNASGYDGLDVTVRGYADPVFQINPTFASQNPGLVLDIQRTSLTLPANQQEPLQVPLPMWGSIMFFIAATYIVKRRISKLIV